MAARVAHNHEVPGSSPGPATKHTSRQIRQARHSTWLTVRPVIQPDARSDDWAGPATNKNHHFGGFWF